MVNKLTLFGRMTLISVHALHLQVFAVGITINMATLHLMPDWLLIITPGSIDLVILFSLGLLLRSNNFFQLRNYRFHNFLQLYIAFWRSFADRWWSYRLRQISNRFFFRGLKTFANNLVLSFCWALFLSLWKMSHHFVWGALLSALLQMLKVSINPRSFWLLIIFVVRVWVLFRF